MAAAIELPALGWRYPVGGSGSGFTNAVVDANDEGWAAVFQAYTADPITHLGFRYGARAGTPPTYSIRLEGVDASGNPDNTDVGGGSPTAVAFTPPADTTINGLWQWKTLTNPFTPSRGQFLASVIRYSSGTIDGSNNSSFGRLNGGYQEAHALPYTLTMTGAAWTKANGCIFGWRTASGRFGSILQLHYSTSTANTAGHRSGMYFTLPAGQSSSYKVLGLRFAGDIGVATGSCIVGIWDTSWNPIQTVTLDSDHTGQTVASNSGHQVIFDEATLTALNFGTKYYCGLEVVSGAVSMFGWSVAEAEDRRAFPNGTNRGLVTWNGTTTTETDTTMPICELVLDDITGSAAGGLLIHPGMTGGFQG